MFVMAGSASTHATSPGSSAAARASTSLNGATLVVSVGSTGGPIRPSRGTTRQWRVQRHQRLVDGAVVAPVEHEDLLAVGRLPGEAEREPVRVGRARCDLPEGSPNRCASSSATASESSVGSMNVMPCFARSAITATAAGGECPVIAPVSPRQKSTYSWPSTSTTRAPDASAANTGNCPGQHAIQFIGTLPSSDPAARVASCCEPGWARANRSASSARSAASRSRSIARCTGADRRGAREVCAHGRGLWRSELMGGARKPTIPIISTN